MDNKNSEFVSQITFFPPLTPEENESSVSSLFSKLFKFSSKPKNEEETKENESSASNSVTESKQSTNKEERNEESETTETKTEDDNSEGTSFQNVFRRLSSLVPLKNSNVTRYADTEQARYWMSDSVSHECYECGARFNAFRRKHHCRVCGQIFCSRCCSHRVPGHVCGCVGGLRVCTYCCKLVLGYLQNADSGASLTADLKALQEHLKEKTVLEEPKVEETGFLLNGGADSLRYIDGEIDSDSTQEIYNKLYSSLPLQQHRFRLLRYPGVWRGGDIIEWLIENIPSMMRLQATEFCQTLIKDGFLECVTEQQHFVEYALYKPITSSFSGIPETSLDRNSLTSSVSSYCLDLDITDKSALLQRKNKKDKGIANINTLSGEAEVVSADDSSFNESKPGCNMIDAAGEEHLRLLLVQGLTRANLSHTWSPILLPLCKQAANMILPDITSSEWDVRRCVRVKRVPGGSINESHTIGGIVFSKNVAHRSMLGKRTNPKILLLHCSIVYHRVDGKIVSLEPVIMQEREYLKNCCARIVALQPDVILVQGNVSRLAQDELKEQGVTLVLNVRQSVLQRVARFSGADIVTSVDARIEQPKLGICKAFYLQNFPDNHKTLMVLEGYGSEMKACSIILRGAPLEELGLVKKVISFILLAVYNWRLEKSFLEDTRATLPMSNTSLVFTDNSKENSPSETDSKTDIIKQKLSSKSSSSIKENENIISDPLMNKNSPAHKKTDSDKGPLMSCGIAVNDFSDPLRSGQLAGDDDVFTANHSSVTLKTDVQSGTLKERWNVEESLLSMSPNIRMCTPFLESEPGKKCSLRHYYCSPLFSHYMKAPGTPRQTNKSRKFDDNATVSPKDNTRPSHEFVERAITKVADDQEVKKTLANFRATGTQLAFANIVKRDPVKKQETNVPVSKIEKVIDPLDPELHQRLYVLFYSFSPKSTNAPEFCIDPWIVRMDMYGMNDIPLSGFLERNCFLPQYSCSSQTCRIPLNQHERKFVHGNACITVTCSVVDSSATRGNAQRITDDKGKQNVMWWCRCFSCSGALGGSEATCLRPPSLALSLAKYLEMRFHAPRYCKTNSCQHSLNHHHAHYFTCGNITACFKYTEIESWDICLPNSSIITNFDTRVLRESLLEQVYELVQKGHEIFSGCGENEMEKEQSHFKQHMDQIQMNLTSISLQDQHNNAGVVRWLWSISDALIVGEKILQESMDKLTLLNNAKPKSKPNQEIVDEKPVESDDNSQIDTNVVENISDKKGIASNPTETEHVTGEEEEDKGDKKGLKTMLSQLLSNTHRGNHNGVVLCNGVIPVIVLAGEVSSVAAAALASLQYHQQMQNILQVKTNSHPDNNEKEYQPGNSKEKPETDSKTNKNAKNTDHIDVQLQDGLLCKVYYAADFYKLRSVLLCPISSNPHIKNDFSVNASQNIENNLTESNKSSSASAKEKENTVSSDKEDSVVKNTLDDKIKKVKTSSGQECLSEIEECFIRSLSRCSPWAARGGKSGSTFFKTKDDRFILKEMSKLELQLFLDLAPHYFDYIQSCYYNKYPSLLGRIVGVFRVDSTNGVGGGVLVMENLWHGRDAITQRFDLKGVQRNRLAEQDSEDVVLLDENFLNLRWKSPIYLQSHSSRVLWAAIQRDTTFLSTHHVMDYSLLVGLDDSKQELVLGIIDYIRTFTWDKKLEHYVKKGLGSGLPTIVSPEQYKSRFSNAFKKYFLQSPNQWEDLDQGLILNLSSNC